MSAGEVERGVGGEMQGWKDEREAGAHAVLEAEGLAGEVRSAGPDGEIAAVSGAELTLERVRQLAPRLRALGYRYVALDLEVEGP